MDLEGLKIEQARPLDALPTLALHRAVLAEREWFITLPHELDLTLEEREHQIRGFDESDNCVFLVARIPQERCVGFLTLRGGTLSRLRHAAKLEVMVAPQWRGHGVGKALLGAGIAWAEASSVLTKVGLAVFATNERALALYRRFGFSEEGRRPREYRLEDGSFRDDVLLYRFVDAP
jgi:RimJ/RimL family protein N-acetyltransferase